LDDDGTIEVSEINLMADAQYLEAAPDGWYTEESDSSGDYNIGSGDPYIQWGSNGDEVGTTAQLKAIGTGLSNTESIADFHDNLSTVFEGGTVAATVCLDFSIVENGIVYDDWFLPSIGEWDAIRTNLFKQNLGGISSGGSYWSSSEYDKNYAYSKGIWGGGHVIQEKSSTVNQVRPIRAF
jgi:hypothetical protein